MSLLFGVGAIVLLLAAHGVFVAGEFGLVAAPRERLEREGEKDPRARLAVRALQKLSFLLSGAQLGITLTSLLVGFLVEATLAEAFQPLFESLGASSTALAHGLAAGFALALVSTTEMVLAELVPKNYAIARPIGATRYFVGPLWWFSNALKPLISFLNASANWLVRKLGVEPREELRSVRSLEELELLIRTSGEHGSLDREEAILLRRSIRFGHRTVADALVPRVDIVPVRHDASIADLFDVARTSGHSRFPVYGQDLDDILGVAHVIDGLRVPVDRRPSTPVTAIGRLPFVTPVTRPLDDLLVEMKERGEEFAIAIDEYGGTDGIVTLEDLLEELVGEIDDEYDPAAADQSSAAAVLADGSWVIDGSLHLDEVTELTGFAAAAGDYETIAGFVLERLGLIPEAGAIVEHAGWTLEVLRVDRRRIARLRLRRTAGDGEASEGAEGAEGEASE
ncbi:MAG: hemolysin family protein [Acidimicrobiales bacterium]